MSINTVSRIEGEVRVNNVLVSVFDKSGLEGLIPAIKSINGGVTFYSTGGTYSKIEQILGKDSSAHLVSVSDYTGQPEMQGGLVKTLDFKIYLGLLSESYNDAHKRDLDRTGAVEFDMVIVNLYPFEETISKAGATIEDARANIDIGGPCMLRAAAKNFLRVLPVCDPGDYEAIQEELGSTNGAIGLETRYKAARKAFSHTAEYDTAIAQFLAARSARELEEIYTT